MPCRSDYLGATDYEVKISRVACLLDELDGKGFDSKSWDGYHPTIYNDPKQRQRGDELTAELCSRLQEVNVQDYSLEMQIWWRDHQAADKLRVEHELARKKSEEERKAAIAKLTPHERKLLGLQE